MSSTPTAHCDLARRRTLAGLITLLPLGLGAGASVRAAEAEPVDAPTLAALRAGGVVLVLRHALAPGTFDPPGFVLGQCSTQRNLSDEGRSQARRTGAWLQRQALRPRRVRSSQWCRCQETARLAFGTAEDWPVLNSLAAEGPAEAERSAALTQALGLVPAGAFEVWVTHQFNIRAMSGESTGSGDGVVLRAAPAGAGIQLVGSWRSV